MSEKSAKSWCWDWFAKTVATALTIKHCFTCRCLIEGPHLLDAKEIDSVPGKAKILAKAKQAGDSPLLLVNYVHHLVRTVLFLQMNKSAMSISISEVTFGKKTPLRPLILLFCEGLACFELARQTQDEDTCKWIAKGKSVHVKFQLWNKYCKQNFLNKMQLLEAESLSVEGKSDEAEQMYMNSIGSAILRYSVILWSVVAFTLKLGKTFSWRLYSELMIRMQLHARSRFNMQSPCFCPKIPEIFGKSDSNQNSDSTNQNFHCKHVPSSATSQLMMSSNNITMFWTDGLAIVPTIPKFWYPTRYPAQYLSRGYRWTTLPLESMFNRANELTSPSTSFEGIRKRVEQVLLWTCHRAVPRSQSSTTWFLA